MEHLLQKNQNAAITMMYSVFMVTIEETIRISAHGFLPTNFVEIFIAHILQTDNEECIICSCRNADETNCNASRKKRFNLFITKIPSILNNSILPMNEI